MNVMNANPWVIDTPQGTAATPFILYQGNIQHAQIEYVDYTSPGDFCEVWDRYNNLIARLVGKPDLSTVRTGRMGWSYGMQVPTQDQYGKQNLRSGKILFYYE